MASEYGRGTPAHQNMQYLPPYGIGQPGSQVISGGGGSLDPYWHNEMDARRSMFRRVPSAQYPDGYLGTITSRREDRLLDSIKHRENARSYTRGVHKGERIDPVDYFWPESFHPMSGLLRQAGLR